MTTKEAQRLRPGDEVFWTDPDGGTCSKYITILTIEVQYETAIIVGKDGSSLECYVSELS